ncbi:hypothetical protein C8P63_12813 [Melghirimyces profundicolus]|uniref:Uncharacterized protein n=1 Tax=Melghirimyces profundicolus TaxID=1242148 RepID=A0A2T6BC87_9BACL|nr:hypothetical protein [Melghirimyces profundicolus]PTX53652.1 hypothetical protein C8P63_12813 [Melghirimyces profundicolus]
MRDTPLERLRADKGVDTEKDTPSPAGVQEEERIVQLWKGIKTTLHPILDSPEPKALWESARSKLWMHYELDGMPYGPTDAGFWMWLEDRNRKVSHLRTPEENRKWEEGLKRVRANLEESGTFTGKPASADEPS